MAKSFLISGMGRSGTLFLATMLNRSSRWTVQHEPQPLYYNEKNFAAIQSRFERDHYGEVNSYLRRGLLKLEVAKKGIIIRDPCAVFLSVCNWERDFLHNFGSRMPQIIDSFAVIDRAATSAEVRKIIFERMITEVEYTNQVIAEFGVHDVSLDEQDLARKIHQSQAPQFASFRDLPEFAVTSFRKHLAWFADKYHYPVR